MTNKCPESIQNKKLFGVPRSTPKTIGSKVSQLGITLLFSDAWCRFEKTGRQGGTQTKHSRVKMLLQVGQSVLRECARERIHFELNVS